MKKSDPGHFAVMHEQDMQSRKMPQIAFQVFFSGVFMCDLLGMFLALIMQFWCMLFFLVACFSFFISRL